MHPELTDSAPVSKDDKRVQRDTAPTATSRLCHRLIVRYQMPDKIKSGQNRERSDC